jgi:signal transduction histidine kinase/CheY-like chemotaxis protein
MHDTEPEMRQRHRRQWLLLAAGILGLAALLSWGLAQQRSALLEDEGRRLGEQAGVVERSLARKLRSTQQMLDPLTAGRPLGPTPGEPAAMNAMLRALAEVHAGVRTISVVDAEGRVFASNRDELVGTRFAAERDYFKAARSGNDVTLLYLSAPFRTAAGVHAMNATRVMQDAQGRFAGVVTATLDPDDFSLLLSSVNFAPDMWSAVAHETGPLVMASPPHPDLDGVNLNTPGSMFARHLAAGGEPTLLRDRMAPDGEVRLIAQRTVREPAVRTDHALVVAVSRSEAAVLSGWYRLAAGAAAMSALLLAVAAGGLRWMQGAEREAADRLAESQDRLDRIGQTAPGVICQFVLHTDGHASMPFATRPLEPYFGLSVSTVPGSADAMFVHMDPAHVEAMRNDILESARTLQPYRHEFMMHVPGQPSRWLDVHSVPQRRDDGSTVWTGLVMDSTETHAARQAQLALEAAQNASRAKSEFLSRASHELRTPLNAVIGFSSLLLSHPHESLTNSQREQLGYIHDAGQHLLALINDLLDVSSIESGHVQAVIEDVPLAALAAEVLSTVREQAAAAGVQLFARVDAPRLAARADRVRLKQVLLNLLSNAIKYNHAGGSVTLAVDGSPEDGARIEVQDTGEGLSGEQRAHLFEPFNRLGADRRGIAGTGIGLTISKMLVELMQGRLSVDSTPGQGSRFAVQLPASAQPAEAAPPGPAPRPSPAVAAHDGLHVLYVEDHPMNALFVQRLLALRPAVQLALARSGSEALQAIRRERPDLLLVDLHLGDMSGFDLLARLRADPGTAQLRCAALTADALPATQQCAAAAGFFDFVTKPVDVHRLLQLIDREALAQAVARAHRATDETLAAR